MTIQADAAVGATAVQPRRRLRRLVALVVVVVLVCTGASIGIAVLIRAHAYQPLRPGPLGSSSGLHAVALTDGIEETRMVVVGPAGTQARVEVSLQNTGSHDVQLLGLAQPSGFDRLLWGPAADRRSLLGGSPAEARALPTTLHAHSWVSLWLFINQPDCQRGTTATYDQVPIRWSALGVHHLYWLPLRSPLLPVTVCPPAAARRHVSHF